jgi:hypothetical protein
MFTAHPAVLTNLAEQHIETLVQDATTHRLAAVLSRGRRQRWPDDQPKASLKHQPGDQPKASLKNQPQTQLQHAGRLATCELTTGQVR